MSDRETQYFSETLADGTITVTIAPVKGADGLMHLPGTLTTGTLADGTVVEATGAGSYSIHLTPDLEAAFATGTHKFSLSGLSFVPEANFSGGVSISFTTAVQDTGRDRGDFSSTVSFNVTPGIDTTTTTAGALAGQEDAAIALNVTINHQDLAGTGNWGSETASVVISGVPAGARIDGASNNGPTTVNGVTTYSWTVDRSSAHMAITDQGITLKNVSYVSPPDDSSDVQLTFSAMTVHLLPDAGGNYALGDTLGLYGHDIALNQSCQLVVRDTDIQVSYDATNRTLSFSGSDDYATYADLAKSVVLSNTGGSLVAGERSFCITLYDDGNAPGQAVTTTVGIGDGSQPSLELGPDAHGTVYWNGVGPVLGGADAADSFYMHGGTDWSLDQTGGTDTLMLGCGHTSWTFQVDPADTSMVHLTATDDSHQSGIIHLDAGSAIDPFTSTADQVVFNGSANGTIDFGNDHVVTFQHLEKVHG